MRRLPIFVLAILMLCGAGATYWWHGKSEAAAAAVDAAKFKTPEETDAYVRFDMEAYDIIQAHFWKQGSGADLSQLFQLSLAKAASTSIEPLPSPDRAGVAKMLAQAFAGLSGDAKKQLALQVVTVALYNLPPNGRNNILSSQAQTDLKNTVDNVNPSQDLYAELGLQKGASTADVEQAYQAKSKELEATTSASGKAELAQVQKAHEALANPTDKQIYDTNGAQPTVFSHLINSKTLYLRINSVAPTTIQEISAAFDAASTTKSLTNLILDVRGNIGGDLTFAQEFLSLFFGPNQYAFDLFHQGNLEVQRTGGVAQSSELSQFKEIAVLTDNMTQSTAELTASALKHDHLAYTVGSTSRGWGSVEQIFPMQTVIDPSEAYALELVVYLTVRYDGNPIEGSGVVPDVDTSNSNWKSQLSNYFTSPEMIQALKDQATAPPLQ